jgi:hypothetical protein
MSGLLRSSGGGGLLLKSLHSEAGGAGLSWGWRTGNGGQPCDGGCSNVGITYTVPLKNIKIAFKERSDGSL